MKLAYFSPLNPQPSGISDYSEELLPYLAAHADIDLFVDGFVPSDAELLERFSCFDYKKHPSKLDRLSEYDAAIYHLGNDHRYHAGIFRVMQSHPGIAVFHEYIFQDFFLGQAYELKNWQQYLDEVEACYGPGERAKAEESIQRGDFPPQATAPLDYPLNCRLARSAEGIIAHSEWSRVRLSKVVPDIPTVRINMPIKVLNPTLRRTWVTKDPLRHFVSIASFGGIIPRKGIDQTLQALAGLTQEVDFHFTLVGAENPYWDVRELILRHGLSEHVTITGHVSLEEFNRHIAATDIAINLREYTVGETSASLCRIMSVGVPAVVSDIGWFSEIPDECVVKVMPDENFVATLRSALRKLIKDESLRRRIGEKAREFVVTEHNAWRTAERYIDFVREVINQPSSKLRRPSQLSVFRSEPSTSIRESAKHRPVSDRTGPQRQLKVAYFSPLNPQPSGISDYSEELLMHLRNYLEADLFVDGFAPSNPLMTTSFRVFDYQKDPSVLERLSEYDAVVYHVGNDHRYHSGIYKVMQRHPGIVVFHDVALQDFFIGLARDEGRMSIYLDELEACYGKDERAKAQDYLRRGALPPHNDVPLDFPLNCRMARSAEGIIVHSEWSLERLRAVAAGVPIARIKHHITAQAAMTPAIGNGCRKNGQVMIASFGLISRDKAIERALRALSALRDEFDFHYTMVGASGNFPELPQLVRNYGLENHVSITDYVSLEEFQRRILDTDIAINLRERPVGATSGSLCRIMAAGIPAIVSNVGAFSELPDNAVVKIDHDVYVDALLLAYLRKLIEDPSLRARIGRNAREYVLAEHNIEISAENYAAFIREVIGRRPRKQLINKIATEMSSLGVRASDEPLLRDVASELAVLAPVDHFDGTTSKRNSAFAGIPAEAVEVRAVPGANGHFAPVKATAESPGRMPKVEGIDYRRGALEYTSLLSPDLNYYLRTKPFCNLHKPIKYSGDGMDPETHRHFNDFANMAVALALRAESKILDVGCGPGWLSEYFARLGYDVTGIDISDDLIQIARERLERLPYQVDQETPLKCRFLSHDIEAAPLAEKFDAVICYDALHHFEDEQNVFRHLAAMLEVGGLLFILEGKKPLVGSVTEEVLRRFMQEYKTLESPFSDEYLLALLDKHGFAIVGNFVSVNGFFEREMLENIAGDLHLPLRKIDMDYHYLTCLKVAQDAPASSVPDSRKPGLLRAELALRFPMPPSVEPGAKFKAPVVIKNTGDTLWLTAQTVRAGIVMPGVRILDQHGKIISELHGHPMLPRAIPPGRSIALDIECPAPATPGPYTVKIDLVDQHVCWFEERGSEPLVFTFEVENEQ
ncbi:MAG: glycosyltransferase [Pyrinomonadaceae bacterium]